MDFFALDQVEDENKTLMAYLFYIYQTILHKSYIVDLIRGPFPRGKGFLQTDKYALSECLEIISTYEGICLLHLTSGRRERHIGFVDKYNGT